MLPSASSSDDDTWIYIDSGSDIDKFYFGDSAPGGTYAWYEDSPGDALYEVCVAYATNATTSLTDISDDGAMPPVVYLGRHLDDDAILRAMHSHTTDFTAQYYVAWSLSEQIFKIVEDDYSGPGSTTDHWRWRNVRSEALNPIFRPNLDGSFPTATKELFDAHALLVDWAGHNWTIRHEKHGSDTTARGSWTGYGLADTIPFLVGSQTYRGVVDSLDQVTSPENLDVVFVRTGSTAQLYEYFTGANEGWYVNHYPAGIDRLLGVFRSREEADSRVGHFNTGEDVYMIIGYRLYKLDSFTPGTTATHSYFWKIAEDKDPIAIYWLDEQTERIGTLQSKDVVTGTDKIRIVFNEDTPDESYDGGENIGIELFANADIDTDIDTIGSTETTANIPANHVFRLPAGRYSMHCHIETGLSGDLHAGAFMYEVQSGTDKLVLHEAIPFAQVLDGRGSTIEFDEPHFESDGTEQFYMVLDGFSEAGSERQMAGYISFTKVA